MTETPDYTYDPVFKGFILPKHIPRNEHSGYDQSRNDKIKQNIVTEDENGNIKTIPFDAETKAFLDRINTDPTGKAVSKPIDCIDVIAKKGELVAQEAAKKESNLSSTIFGEGNAMEPLVMPAPTFSPINDRVQVLEAPVAKAKTKARIPVRMKGTFGALRVLYDEVFVDNVCLVLVQKSDDELFYEAPMNSDEHIDIEINGKTKQCLPGLHFTLPDRRTAFTIYLIDEA